MRYRGVRRGAAVLLSSHILAEVEKLCDTVTIIRAGRTVAGSLQQLRHLMRTTVTARTRAGDPGVWDWPGVHDAGTGNGELRLSVDRDHLDATMGRLTRLGIVDLTVTPASLEDLFLREYRGAYPDEGAMTTAAGALNHAPASASPFTGLAALIRFALRRDRTRLLVWISMLTLMMVYAPTRSNWPTPVRLSVRRGSTCSRPRRESCWADPCSAATRPTSA